MDLIDNTTLTPHPIGREMTRLEAIADRVKSMVFRVRRRLPHLVWRGDEIDVRVTLSTDRLNAADTADAFRQLHSGAFTEIERLFRDMGIGFDTGMGPDGRDWEWDFSLKGPISVQFRSRAQRPERRMERPKPKLVVNNKP